MPLSGINTVPVSVVHGRTDVVCPLSMAEIYYNEITSSEKYLIIDEFGHGEYGFSASAAGMIQVVKTGNRDPESSAFKHGLIGLILSAAILF